MSGPGRWLLLVTPPLLAVVAALRAAGGEFIRDDVLYVVTNPYVAEPVPPGHVFSTPFQPDFELGLHRPLVTWSFRLDLRIGLALTGGAPLPEVFHATNMILAAGAAALLAALARRLGLGIPAAAAAAAVFAAHAARSEAVCWISGRAENLMTLFSLGALRAAAGPGGRFRGPLAALLAVLAFWSKEQGAVLPLLALLLPGVPRRDRLARAGWMAAALGLAVLWRAHVLGGLGPQGSQQVLGGAGFGERLLIGLGFLGGYVRLAFWPHPLRNEYDDPAGPPGFLEVLPAAAFLLVLGGLFLRRRRFPAFALSLFAVPLLPVLNVVWRTGETFAERFLALPIAGFGLVAGGLAAAKPRLFLPLAAAVAVLNLVLAFQRAPAWLDEHALFEEQYRNSPEEGSSAYMLGTWFQSRATRSPAAAGGMPDPAMASRALDLFEEAIRKAPHLVPPRLELAKLLKALARPPRPGAPADAGKLARAEAEARAAVRLAPHLAHPLEVLGEVLALRGHPEAAASAHRAALDLDPREVRVGLDLVQILESLGQRDEARRVLLHLESVAREGMRRRWWDAQPCQVLSGILFKLSRGRESPAILGEALDRAVAAPQIAALAGELRDLLTALGRAAEAEEMLASVARRLEDRIGGPRPHSELYVALSQLADSRRRPEEAVLWLDRALAATRSPEQREHLRQSLAARRK